ncbi:hypothetical protein B2J96_08065 [Mycobacterium shigaense]|nr:hypothetical protein B2J96_08065 [Mycobacterium shigaense]
MVINAISFANSLQAWRRSSPTNSVGADPAPSWTCRWAGLRHQGRQLQLQTRLRSMCRRATKAIRRCGLATVTAPLCHGS